MTRDSSALGTAFRVTSKLLFMMALTTLSSCGVVGDIFKTGMGVGVFIVVIIIIIILFIVSRMGGRDK